MSCCVCREGGGYVNVLLELCVCVCVCVCACSVSAILCAFVSYVSVLLVLFVGREGIMQVVPCCFCM